MQKTEHENPSIPNRIPRYSSRSGRPSSRRSSLTIREMCVLALAGATIYAAKMMLAGLPNIEPVSLMVMLLAVCWGWKGLWSVYIYVFLEYLTWGIQLWSISYLYVWLMLFVLARLLKNMKGSLEWALLSGSFGLSFGALCAVVQIFVSGVSGAVSWWISGIPFDVAHGLGNFVFCLLLWKPMKHLMERLMPQ